MTSRGTSSPWGLRFNAARRALSRRSRDDRSCEKCERLYQHKSEFVTKLISHLLPLSALLTLPAYNDFGRKVIVFFYPSLLLILLEQSCKSLTCLTSSK